MSAAHTPGPWFSDRHGRIWRRDPAELYENGGGVAGDMPVAMAEVGWYGEGVRGYPMEANARLIAAAPELLEACRLTLAWYEADKNPSGTTFCERLEMWRASEEAIRAAIAKATGGAQ